MLHLSFAPIWPKRTRGARCCTLDQRLCHGEGCQCTGNGEGCLECGDLDGDGEVNYTDWEVWCTGVELSAQGCCELFQRDIDRDGDFDDVDCTTFWERVLAGTEVCDPAATEG